MKEVVFWGYPVHEPVDADILGELAKAAAKNPGLWVKTYTVEREPFYVLADHSKNPSPEAIQSGLEKLGYEFDF